MKAVKKEDFLVKAIVHEVRELKNTTDAGITPYIKITCGNKSPQ